MSIFNIGDKVKIVNKKHGIPCGTVGYIYEITEILPFDKKKTTLYRFIANDDNDYQGTFYEEDLVLEDKNEP